MDVYTLMSVSLLPFQLTIKSQVSDHLAPTGPELSCTCSFVKAPKSSHITSILRSLHWLKINECIEYKLLSLTYKVLTTTQPSYLHNLITVQPPRSTRSGLTEGNRIFGHTRSSIHIIFFTNNRSFLPVCFPSSLESTSGSPQSTPQ